MDLEILIPLIRLRTRLKGSGQISGVKREDKDKDNKGPGETKANEHTLDTPDPGSWGVWRQSDGEGSLGRLSGGFDSLKLEGLGEGGTSERPRGGEYECHHAIFRSSM